MGCTEFPQVRGPCRPRSRPISLERRLGLKLRLTPEAAGNPLGSVSAPGVASCDRTYGGCRVGAPAQRGDAVDPRPLPEVAWVVNDGRGPRDSDGRLLADET